MKIVVNMSFSLRSETEISGENTKQDLDKFIICFLPLLGSSGFPYRLTRNQKETLRELSLADEIKCLCQEIDYGPISITSSIEGSDQNPIVFNYMSNAVIIKYTLPSSTINTLFLRDYKEKLVSCLSNLSRLLTKNTYSLKGGSGIEVEDFWFERSAPSKSLLDWGEFNLIDVFWTSNSWSSTEKLTADEDTIFNRSKTLPKLVKREISEQILIIDWVNELSNIAELAGYLGVRETWYVNHFQLPPELGYNEEGDIQQQSIGFENHPLLHFYNPRANIGYVNVRNEAFNNSLREELQEYADWLKQGSLPDSTPVNKLRLIVAERNLALDVMLFAVSIGFDQVLYFDKNMHLWDPQPSMNLSI